MEDEKQETPKEEVKKEEPKASENLAKVVEDMQKANKERKEIIEQEKEIIAQKLLGGNSEAGNTQTPTNKEMSDIDYAKLARQGKIPLKD